MTYRPSFDEKYVTCLADIRDRSFAGKTEILGAELAGDGLRLPFFNRQLIFSSAGVHAADGETLTIAVKLALCRYLAMCPDRIVNSAHRLITFRELSDSGPLFSSFTANTNKIIESAFSGRLDLLRARCQMVGGHDIQMPAFDLSMQFMAFPRIPVTFTFNDADDIMPATANFLYDETADRYLDIECLMVTCTYLTGLLIQGT